MAAAIAVSKTLKPPPPLTGNLTGFVSVSPSAMDASLTLVLSKGSLFLSYSLGWLVLEDGRPWEARIHGLLREALHALHAGVDNQQGQRLELFPS